MPSSVSADPADAGDIVSIPKVPELERLQLHNLFLEQQVCREQLNVLTLQFLQTMQPKALQERIERITSQINTLAQRVFADARIDAQAYQLNVEEGAFVRRARLSVKE
jgi:hypothetical protein